MQTLAAFFAERTSTRPAILCRIAIGLASAMRAYMQYSLLKQLYSGDVIPARNFPGLPDCPPQAAFVAIATSLAFAAGYKSRITGALSLAFHVYLMALDSNLYANNTYTLTLILFLFTLPDYTQPTIPRWQSLLPRLQVTIIYAYSAIFKMNANFLSGATTSRSMRLPEAWLDTPLPALLAFGALAIEVFIPIALWLPRLRPAAFAAGALLHLAIIIGMERLYTGAMISFSITMLAPFLLFLEPQREGATDFKLLRKLLRL